MTRSSTSEKGALDHQTPDREIKTGKRNAIPLRADKADDRDIGKYEPKSLGMQDKLYHNPEPKVSQKPKKDLDSATEMGMLGDVKSERKGNDSVFKNIQMTKEGALAITHALIFDNLLSLGFKTLEDAACYPDDLGIDYPGEQQRIIYAKDSDRCLNGIVRCLKEMLKKDTPERLLFRRIFALHQHLEVIDSKHPTYKNMRAEPKLTSIDLSEISDLGLPLYSSHSCHGFVSEEDDPIMQVNKSMIEIVINAMTMTMEEMVEVLKMKMEETVKVLKIEKGKGVQLVSESGRQRSKQSFEPTITGAEQLPKERQQEKSRAQYLNKMYGLYSEQNEHDEYSNSFAKKQYLEECDWSDRMIGSLSSKTSADTDLPDTGMLIGHESCGFLLWLPSGINKNINERLRYLRGLILIDISNDSVIRNPNLNKPFAAIKKCHGSLRLDPKQYDLSTVTGSADKTEIESSDATDKMKLKTDVREVLSAVSRKADKMCPKMIVKHEHCDKNDPMHLQIIRDLGTSPTPPRASRAVEESQERYDSSSTGEESKPGRDYSERDHELVIRSTQSASSHQEMDGKMHKSVQTEEPKCVSGIEDRTASLVPNTANISNSSLSAEAATATRSPTATTPLTVPNDNIENNGFDVASEAGSPLNAAVENETAEQSKKHQDIENSHLFHGPHTTGFNATVSPGINDTGFSKTECQDITDDLQTDSFSASKEETETEHLTSGPSLLSNQWFQDEARAQDLASVTPPLSFPVQVNSPGISDVSFTYDNYVSEQIPFASHVDSHREGSSFFAEQETYIDDFFAGGSLRSAIQECRGSSADLGACGGEETVSKKSEPCTARSHDFVYEEDDATSTPEQFYREQQAMPVPRGIAQHNVTENRLNIFWPSANVSQLLQNQTASLDGNSPSHFPQPISAQLFNAGAIAHNAFVSPLGNSCASTQLASPAEINARVHLSPVTVHAAGSRPPWATTIARIDLTRASNREFTDLRARRATFDVSWDPNNSGIDAASMALAGFFRPERECPRRVRCFYCGLELDFPSDVESAWEEHVRHRPTCQYLRAIKGEKAITELQLKINKKDR